MSASRRTVRPLPSLVCRKNAAGQPLRWLQTDEEGANGAGDPQKSPHVLNGLLAEGSCRGRGHRAGRLGRHWQRPPRAAGPQFWRG